MIEQSSENHLKVALLCDKLNLKVHVKPRQRSKNSTVFWALKSCKRQKDKEKKSLKENNYVTSLKKSKLLAKPKLEDKVL